MKCKGGNLGAGTNVRTFTTFVRASQRRDFSSIPNIYFPMYPLEDKKKEYQYSNKNDSMYD